MSGTFSLDFSVRDYECDLQGVVNNAVYQNYLEHTRHEYLHSHGLDFAELTAAGVHMVVMRAELDYLHALVSGDRFRVDLNAERISRRKVVFHQQVVRLADEVTVLRARIVTGVMARSGHRKLPPPLEALLEALPPGDRPRP